MRLLLTRKNAKSFCSGLNIYGLSSQIGGASN
jgi:hypothetical protein